jgi:hypothetical protein
MGHPCSHSAFAWAPRLHLLVFDQWWRLQCSVSGWYSTFEAQKIWSALAEPKCKLFSWLALHAEILTADMLAIRRWPHGPICQLCLGAPETATHLCKDCLFTIAVWNLVQSWDRNANPGNGQNLPTIPAWWDELIRGIQRASNVTRVVVCYMWSRTRGRK